MKFLEPVKFKIVDKLQGVELAEYEHQDLLLLEGVAFHDGVNANGAFIELADAQKDISTFTGKPIRILFDGTNPTGHGYDPKTNTFSDAVKEVGFIHNARVETSENGNYDALVQAIVWRDYHPEIADRITDLLEEGNLKFSIEAERDFETMENGTRKCYNNNFKGLSIVANPAWNRTRSLMVAEEETNDEGENIDMENENTQQETTQETKSVETKTEPTAETVEEESKQAVEQPTTKEEYSKEDFLELQGKVTRLTNSLLEYQTVVEGYQAEKIGNERLEKVSQYGVTDKTVEELGKMSKEDFVTYYENVINDFASKLSQETPDHKTKDIIQGLFHKEQPKTDSKDALQQILQGLI